jgi:hypothetical protein
MFGLLISVCVYPRMIHYDNITYFLKGPPGKDFIGSTGATGARGPPGRVAIG